MTVQDVFNLRKEGKTTEAWEAIKPMFAVHKGHYTSLAYFWLASDLLGEAVKAKNSNLAKQLLFKMTQAYPYTEDKDGRGNRAIIVAALRVDDLFEQFNLAFFMPYFEKLTKDDWKAQKIDGHWVPSLGERVIAHLFRNLEDRTDMDYVASIVPMLHTALSHHPNDKNNLRILAKLYIMEQKPDKAEEVLRQIIGRYKDSAACHQLSTLVKDRVERIALLCQAITWQPQEKFRSRMRVELASLIKDQRPENALFELQTSRLTRTAQGAHIPQHAIDMEKALHGIQPVTAQQEQEFYQRAIAYLESYR